MNRAERWNIVVGLLGLAACVVANLWVFRYGVLFGLVGLNITKHVGVAVLCQTVGVNRSKPPAVRSRTIFQPAHLKLAGPHSLARDAL